MTNLASLPAQAFIYVIGPTKGPQKVGIAGNPEKRRMNFQIGNSAALHISGTVEVSRAEAGAVESYAHWLLRDCAVRGEWFDCSPAKATEAVVEAAAAVRAGLKPPPSREYSERILLPLKPKELAAIDAARTAGEARTELIRKGIKRELKARSRTPSPKP